MNIDVAHFEVALKSDVADSVMAKIDKSMDLGSK